MNISELKTGDLLLFKCKSDFSFGGFFNYLIQLITRSEFTHIGMIVKDPKFNNELNDGIYMWHSYNDMNSNKKGGVEFIHIDEMLKIFKGSEIIVKRTIIDNDDIFHHKILLNLYSKVYDKPYDLSFSDWFQAGINLNINPQKTDMFFCSSFIGYIYTKCGVLENNTNWSVLRPCDFSKNHNHSRINNKFKFQTEEYELHF